MSERTLNTYLAEHPRMIGVLCAILLLVSQAGTALAGTGVVVVHGP